MAWDSTPIVVLLALCVSCSQPASAPADAGAPDSWVGELGPPCAPGERCDRDGDGIFDSDEDFNGDGLLGCCIEGACGKAAATQADCILNADGCGGDQRCVNGRCTPARDRSCSRGELDPTTADTFGDRTPDGQRDNFVCHAHPPAGKPGPKTLQIVRNPSAKADWALGLEPQARYRELTLPDAGDKEAAATVDYPADHVAGFVISLPAWKDDIEATRSLLLARLMAPFSASSVSVRAAGARGKSHDRYDQIRGTILDLSLPQGVRVSELRQQVVAALLGRQPSTLGAPPPAFGAPQKELVLRLSVVRRFAFLRDSLGELELDSDGFPREDTSDGAARRVLIIGGVAPRTSYEDRTLASGYRLDDLSGGTLLAHADAQSQVRCELWRRSPYGVRDLIWVVDEAAYAAGHRARILANTRNFLQRALASGVIARICVVGALDPKGKQAALAGRCCQRPGSVGDAFLDMRQIERVLRCVDDPPGEPETRNSGLAAAEAAIASHLPREEDAPARVRTWATLSVVIWSHRRDALTLDALHPRIVGASQCSLTSAQQGSLETALQPTLDARRGAIDPEAAAVFHAIGGICDNRCGAAIDHGYRYLSGRFFRAVGDICSEDLHYTLQGLLDGYANHSSNPLRLEYIPIPPSIRCVQSGEVLPRSRTAGFDYRDWTNSLALATFVGQVRPLELTCSYQRWLPR